MSFPFMSYVTFDGFYLNILNRSAVLYYNAMFYKNTASEI